MWRSPARSMTSSRTTVRHDFPVACSRIRPSSDVVGVRVCEALAGRAGARRPRRPVEELRGRPAPAQVLVGAAVEGGVVELADAARVVEQHAHGDAVGAGEARGDARRQHAGERRVEREPAMLDLLQRRGGDERLHDAAGAEAVARAHLAGGARPCRLAGSADIEGDAGDVGLRRRDGVVDDRLQPGPDGALLGGGGGGGSGGRGEDERGERRAPEVGSSGHGASLRARGARGIGLATRASLSSDRARGDQAALVGEDDRLHAVAQAELGQQARHVGLDGALRDEQLARDLRVAAGRGRAAENLALAGRQRLELGDGAAARPARELAR